MFLRQQTAAADLPKSMKLYFNVYSHTRGDDLNDSASQSWTAIEDKYLEDLRKIAGLIQ